MNTPNQGILDVLDGVSCAALDSCVAVGYQTIDSFGDAKVVVESWNGTSWSTTSIPKQKNDDILGSVSCVSRKWCMAVGYANGPRTKTSIMRLRHTHWKPVASPNPGHDDLLAGVSCVSPRSCVAVGYSWNKKLVDRTVVESWNGTSWSEISSADPLKDDTLSSVSCLSAAWCMAVGNDFNGTASGTLAESWNGTTWSVTPTPDAATNDSLSTVSCFSQKSCVAVGSDNDGSTSQTLVEHWNGTSWSLVSSPSPGTDSSLTGVSCVSALSCLAVGSSYNGSANQSLIESWNESRWSVVSSPNAGEDDFVNGVACLSSSACSAVGWYDANGSPSGAQTLAESGPAPGIVIGPASLRKASVGTAYSETLAATKGKGTYSWKVSSGSLPEGLSLSPGGVVSGDPTTAGTSRFTIEVKDSTGNTATKGYSFATSLGITPDSLPKAKVHKHYSETLEAAGGTSPYTWTVSSGTLPAGLSLSTSGVISGIPTAAGRSKFSVKVADAATRPHTDTKKYSIATSLNITPDSLPKAKVHKHYSETLHAAGGTSPYTWTVTSGSLPAGLSLSASGVISGRPKKAGTSRFTLKVTDSATPTHAVTKKYSIRVRT